MYIVFQSIISIMSKDVYTRIVQFTFISEKKKYVFVYMICLYV